MNTPAPQNGLLLMDSAQLETMLRRILDEHAHSLLQSISDRQTQQSQTTDENRFLTRLEAAKALKITLPTLHKRMKDGKIQYQRLGRRILIVRDSLPQ
ncbi:MAG: hypothetical protein H9535_01280 [Ignavibacteria bacterium]|nr:hypothetical protein [Ignavibacteria bacterium]